MKPKQERKCTPSPSPADADSDAVIRLAEDLGKIVGKFLADEAKLSTANRPGPAESDSIRTAN